MLHALKSEIRKLLSVRSTYVILFLVLVFTAIYAFYVEGYRGLSGSGASQVNEYALREIVLIATTTGSIFLAVIGILFIVHEYRHNTIMYTLTASNSRTKVLGAKLLALLGFSVAFTAICGLFGLLSYFIGISLRDVSLPEQTFDTINIIGRIMFYNLTYALFGMLLAIITRNIAAAIILLLITPTTVEPLIGLLLKDTAGYLPFTALEKATAIHGDVSMFPGSLSTASSYAVVIVYLLIGWLVAWWLFLRRDAN